MMTRNRLGRWLLTFAVVGMVSACRTTDQEYTADHVAYFNEADKTGAKRFQSDLRLKRKDSGEYETLKLPFTLAIAEPEFRFQQIKTADGQNITELTGASFPTPIGPGFSDREAAEQFPTTPIKGADRSLYTSDRGRVKLTDEEKQKIAEREAAEKAAKGEKAAEAKPEAGELTPGESTPGEAVPGESTPGEAVPGESTPGEAVPGETIREPKQQLNDGDTDFEYQQPRYRQPRRMLIGQRRIPVGINSDWLDRRVYRDLYGVNSNQAGYGQGVGDTDPSAGELTPPDAEVKKAEAAEAAKKKEAGEAAQSFPKQATITRLPQNTSTVDIATRNGWRFEFSKKAYQERTRNVFNQFGLFEDVKLLPGVEGFQPCIEAADNQYADLLMSTTVVRNKVVWGGVGGYWALNSLGLYMPFWFPAWFVRDKEYRVYLDVQVDINDVRSRSLLFSETFSIVKRGLYDDWYAGWAPFSQYVTPITGALDWKTYHGEGTYTQVAKELSASTWLEFERQLVERLHTTFKDRIDSKNFEDTINDSVKSRAFGLVAGVAKYGDSANAVLSRFHRQSLIEASGDPSYDEDRLRKDLQDPNVSFGARPYSEKDGQKFAELMRNGQEVAIPPFYLTELYGAEASRARLMTRIHQLTRARRQDRTFVYLNLETVIVDVDQKVSPDGLAKYLLPHDCDLRALETSLAPLRARIAELRKSLAGASPEERRVTLEKEENRALLNEFRDTTIAFFNANAISFAWLEQQFNRDSGEPLKDHVYLQSQSALLVLDTTFPGLFTELNYAPFFELAMGAEPVRFDDNTVIDEKPGAPGGAGKAPAGDKPAEDKPADKKTGEDKPADEAPADKPSDEGPADEAPADKPADEAPADKPADEAPADEAPADKPSDEAPADKPVDEAPAAKPADAPKTDEPKPEAAPADDKPEAPAEPEKARKPRRTMRLGSYYKALERSLLAAGDKKEIESDDGEKAGNRDDDQVGISNAFLKNLVRPGLIVVLTSLKAQRPIEFPQLNLSGFVYHFTFGAATPERVDQQVVELPGGTRVEETRLLDVLDYVNRRLGRQSRALGRPQQFAVFRKGKDDFVLVQSRLKR